LNFAGNKKAPPSAVSDTEEVVFDVSKYRNMMDSAISHLQHELANIRTGRATPGMLDHLKVEAYGDRVPLKAVGSVSVRNPQLLAISLFDPGLANAVIAGIAQSPLNLNPQADEGGQEVLVPIPTTTGEVLAAMAKMCRAEGETAKVSIRHARKEAMAEVKTIVSEDDRRRLEKEVQHITDEFIAETDRLVTAKQDDIAKHR
jgi:ribosome recycling factor